MPSPFPGMDPYLEDHWQAVHSVLVIDTWRRLNRELPDGLVAQIEQRLVLESDEDANRRVGPDVRVFQPPGSATAAAAVADRTAAVVAAPFELTRAGADDDPIVQRYLRIVDGQNRLVTVIEFVSRSNKQGGGLARFRRNRRDLLAAGVHFAEIDLVRAGRWRALLRPYRVLPRAVTTYRAVVHTAGGDGRRAFLFPMPVRQPLPDVRVPLRTDDAPAVVPLQALVTALYDDGRYDRLIDYAEPLEPPLNAGDAAWAAELLAGRRV